MKNEDVRLVSLAVFEDLEDGDLEKLPVDLIVPGVTLSRDFKLNAIKKALKTLAPREKLVMYCRFFCDKGLREIGDIIGVTQERIRQIEAKALRKLRHPRYSGESGLREGV